MVGLRLASKSQKCKHQGILITLDGIQKFVFNKIFVKNLYLLDNKKAGLFFRINMLKIKSLVGLEVDNITKIIELGLLKNLERALGWDTQQNRERLQALPVFMVGNMINSSNIYKNLGLNINNILLSRESIITHRAIRIGESLRVRTYLRDAYEQQASSNPIGFIILESVGNVDSDTAFYCERVLAVRGGFTRGKGS